MDRKLALWVGVPFLAIAWSLIAAVALAPGFVNGRLLMVLLLALAVAGIVIMLLRVVLRDRANSTLLDTLYPVAGILIAIVVGFHEEVAKIGSDIARFVTPAESVDGMHIARGDDRQFHLSVTVDGGAVDFRVDPRMPFNIVRPDVPKQLGIDPSSLIYDQRLDTATGAEYAADVVLYKAQVGSKVVEALPVKVFATDRFGYNVLGKPFLERFREWEIEDDTLTIVY